LAAFEVITEVIVPPRAPSQESEHSQKNANDFARPVLQNEVKAETNDHSHWKAAKLLLGLPHRCDFFIVGHAAPERRS
jgi:hypothetical protein